MRLVAIACLVSGCGGASPAPVTTPPPPPPQATTPPIPKRDYVVVPAELMDEGVLARIPHRVRVRRFGDSWLSEDGRVMAKRARGDHLVVLPVIDERPSKIRVVFEDDEARIALWIARKDTWKTTLVPLQLSERDGTVRRDSGIWVARGAPLVSVSSEGARRRVQVRDELLTLTGYAPEPALGGVWIAGDGDPPPTLDTGTDPTWKPPPDPRTRLQLRPTTIVRAEPADSAAAIATVTRPDLVAYAAGDAPAGYRKIEIVRRFARIVGFVRASDVEDSPPAQIGTIGTGRGHGFGMSHTDRIEVPAGTCLYDGIEGSVVGVQSAKSVRLGRAKYAAKLGWSLVYVGSNWATLALYVRDVGDDPQQPRFESCTQPVYR